MEKLILGPMATLCHEAFRKLVEEFGGCDEYFTEMINAPALKNGGQWEKFYLMNDSAPEKMVWQLTGNNIDAVAWAAGEVLKKGGIGVDLNMGCSAPQIVKSGCGIVWMAEEKLNETAEMVRKCRLAMDAAVSELVEGPEVAGGSLPSTGSGTDGSIESGNGGSTSSPTGHFRLSAKIRLGDDDFTIEKLSAFCKMLENEGVEMITLHPRTKSEKYRKNARWNIAAELSEKINVPLILNGDIKDRASLEEAKKIVPKASGFMIARAAAQKPWIFKELRLSSGESFNVDLEETALRFIDYLELYQPKEFWKTRLQRFFEYYCLNFSYWHYAQTKLLNCKTPDEARNEIKDYFKRQPSDKNRLVMSSTVETSF